LVAVSVPVLGAPFLSTVKAGSQKVHPRELDIYDPVEQTQDKTEQNQEEITEIEEKVSVARRFVWGWASTVKEGVLKVRQTFSSVEEKSLEFVELIQTDREFQIKVGGISAAVLGGAVMAGKGRRPFRRVLYSAVLGTTAAAICYPKQAVDITLANYDRLKVFIKEQQNTFNQKRAEQAASKELESPVQETGVSKEQDMEEVAEEASVDLKEIPVEVSDVQEKVIQPEDVVEEKPKASFWSRIPFADKFIGSKESATSSANPVAVSEGESVTQADSSKDQVIVQEESSGQAKIEGDIGQSNPEDKDMYSTRS